MNFWKNIFRSKDAINTKAKQSSPKDTIDSKPKTLPIILAVTNGDLEKVNKLLNDNPDLVFSTDNEDKSTLLHIAAQNGHKDIAELLINKDVDVNAKNKYSDTPLHNAARKGHKNVVELLINKGASVNAKGNYGWSPLHYATGLSFYFMADLFRASGIDSALSLIRNSSFGITTVLKIDTTTIGHNNIVELLLENGADVNAMAHGGADLQDYTPLHWSAMTGNTGLAKLLLHYGANVNSCSYPNAMPLHFAAYLGNIEVAELLINNGADVNVHVRGGSPLQFAMAGKSESNKLTASLLRKHGGHELGNLIPSSRFSETGLIG